MKLLLVADYNDADYIEHIVDISEEIFNKFKPLIDAIENYQPYVRHHKFGGIDYHNWISWRQDLGELTLYEKYKQFSLEYIDEFIKVFFDGMYSPEGSDSFHTIVKLENLITNEVYITKWNFSTAHANLPEKCKQYEKEVQEIYAYKRPSDGKPLNSIPFNEMTKEESDLIRRLHTLWMKYV